MNKTALAAGLLTVAAFPLMQQGHAAPLPRASAQSASPYMLHAASLRRDWRVALNEKVMNISGNLSRNTSRLIAPLARSAEAAASSVRALAAAPAVKPVGASGKSESKSADAGGDAYRALTEHAAGPRKSVTEKAPRAAALYLGNSCTAAADVCKQFAAEVAKDKIAAVTAEANGMRPAAGMKVKLRYKF